MPKTAGFKYGAILSAGSRCLLPRRPSAIESSDGGVQTELLLVSHRERAIRTAIRFYLPHRGAAEAAAKRELPGPNNQLMMIKSLNPETQPWPTAVSRPVARNRERSGENAIV